MIVQVVGKRHWHNDLKNKDYHVINTMYQDASIEGFAIKERFVSAEIYNKIVCGRKYEFSFDEGYNGRAFVSDVKEI